MKIMIIVGARPNFMKAGPVIAGIRDWNSSISGVPTASTALHPNEKARIQPILVHTGQHYDSAMSDSFFVDLNLPKPDVCLEVGSGSHAAQTAEIMLRFEAVLTREKPDAVVVVGDVNSTLACALVAARISYDSVGTRPLIAHVEAGLRSFDRGMPEEVNRVLTDHISDILFVSEESGLVNLDHEGISQGKVHFVGNTMIDSLLAYKGKADQSVILDKLGLRLSPGDDAAGKVRPYALLTLHRPSNVDRRDTFLSILNGLKDLAETCPIIFSAHPRTRKQIAEFGLEHFFQFKSATQPGDGFGASTSANGIHLLEPLGYLDFLCLMNHASLVVTDSGGIQEETTCLGVACVTVRENTERPVTVTVGTNVIAGTREEVIREAIGAQMTRREKGRIPEKWDGKAGQRIVEAIMGEYQRRKLLLAEQGSQACLQSKC